LLFNLTTPLPFPSKEDLLLLLLLLPISSLHPKPYFQYQLHGDCCYYYFFDCYYLKAFPPC